MTGEMKDALEACPFCGRSVELQCDRRYVGPDQNFIRCGYIGCVVNPETGNHGDPAGAIAAWNRRPLLSTDKAVGELREAVIEECARVVESQHYLSDNYEVWAAMEKMAAKLRALTASRATGSKGDSK